jgi:cyanophycinase-like exopeptidase
MTAPERNAIVQAEQAERAAQAHGHLVIIGGGEDKQHDMAILKRFVELAGGPSAKIVVITAASSAAEHMWETYDRAFADLGVTRHVHLHMESRHDANDEAHIRDVVDADGIFMTGGDQKRLLSVVSQNPYLQGIGIDEDTALVVKRGVGIEVLGEGAVTIVDGRATSTSVAEIANHETPELIHVRLRLLPAGSRYVLPGVGADDGRRSPPPLLDFLENITKRNPLS